MIYMKFNQPIEQIIRKRYSCRTYEMIPLSRSDQKRIKKVLKTEVGLFGTKIRFELVDTRSENLEKKQKIGTYGMVKGARYFLIGALVEETANYVDFGYLFEKIILKMTEFNLGTIWLSRAFNFDFFSNLVKLNENETIPAVSPVGYIAENKRVVDTLISWGIQTRKRKPWNKLFFNEDFNTPLSQDEADIFLQPLEMVRLAPSARNQQSWRILKQKDSAHFFVKIKQNYIIDAFSYMPLLDIGIALAHFDLSINEQKIKGVWSYKEHDFQFKPRNFKYIATWIRK